jgi:hypothetical protein
MKEKGFFVKFNVWNCVEYLFAILPSLSMYLMLAVVLYDSWIYSISMFITEITMCGSCIFVSMYTSCVSLQTIAFKSSLYQNEYLFISVICFVIVGSLRSVLQQLILFLVRALNKPGNEKKLFIYSLCPCPSIFLSIAVLLGVFLSYLQSHVSWPTLSRHLFSMCSQTCLHNL